ncbi:P-loop containing nucleoside triphosphate hydrolase protein [Amylocystis lapponica]|nr:P-loop containing nucleoside triphosphate hydrolase protein [Amylocystis lapponica]
MLLGLRSLKPLLPDFLCPFIEGHSSHAHYESVKGAYLHTRDVPQKSSYTLYEAWLASRTIPNHAGDRLAPGVHRPFTRDHAKLASHIATLCAFDLFKLLWTLHPWRTLLMMSLDLIRGVFPAFRGYSQALLINELQVLLSSGDFTWSRLFTLVGTEVFRVCMESVVDSFASANENIVHSSARFQIEYRQLEQRVRLDIPTLSDPAIRDLIHESDLFVRSFNGMTSFGLFSTFDLMRILTLVSELVSHVFVLLTLTCSGTHLSMLALSVLSFLLPVIFSWLDGGRTYLNNMSSPQEARTAAKQEKMRSLAHNDTYRPEVLFFGLGPWILHSWARARKTMLGLESQQPLKGQISTTLFSHLNISGLFAAVQNIPLVLILQSSSTSLGSFTLYRLSVQNLFFTVANLLHTVRMAYQGIFLMGAFCAAMEVQPRLQPKADNRVKYRSSPLGVKLEARNLWFTYPGGSEPVLKNINLTVEAGETLAIVGFNGSGKSTLAKVLLRIFEFDSGELSANGVDVRRYHPAEYHAHLTAVFQDFSKFNASVNENIGVGFVQDMHSRAAVDAAICLAGAGELICSLPNGLKTRLDVAGHDLSGHTCKDGYTNGSSTRAPHGLSGGEWQKIAISRAFMRAQKPEVELLLLDEPTSSLDAHAQSRIFDSVEKISRLPNGERTKTVIFITHRLATARRADKIAMMKNGTITEFGTHQQLLKRNGQYAALYRASI